MKFLQSSGILERRKLSRLKLLHHLRVFDRQNFRLLGHLADIHHEGMMLISEQVQKLDQIHQIKILLPETIGSHQEIHFSAKVLWCRNYINPMFHQAGFQIEHIDPRHMQLLEMLVDRFGFQSIFESKVVQYYRGIEGYNCAQSILKAFQHRLNISEKRVAEYAEFGGGNAPNGICGALFAIQQVSRNHEMSCRFENRFKKEVGATLCDEILIMGRLSCTGCIFTAFQILQSHLGDF